MFLILKKLTIRLLLKEIRVFIPTKFQIMKIRLSVIIVLLMFAAMASHAQIHFGATTAFSATAVLDEGLNSDPRYDAQITYNPSPIGFSFGVNLGRKFGLSMEMIQAKQGQIYNIIDVAKQVQGERNIDLTYLQLPLMMNFLGGGSGGVRGNFNFGPQIDILTKAIETVQSQSGTFEIPDDATFTDIQDQYAGTGVTLTDNMDGTYTQGALPSTEVFTKQANDFANTMFSLAAAFGLDIDLSKNLYLTTQVRATYSLTGMRNADVLQQITTNPASLLGEGATVQVGVQLGLHYMIGGTRSKK